MFENKLYVHGGLDIQKGSLETMYELDLSTLADLENENPDDRQRCQWRLVNQLGKKDQQPGPVAHHTACVYKDQLLLFGGNNYQRTILIADPNNDNSEKTYRPLFSFNLKTCTWSHLKTKGDVVIPRDEHTAVIDEHTSQMIVFGGFEEGTRTNEIVIYNMQKMIWQHMKLPKNSKAPCPRSGHAATLFKCVMYVFGGKSGNSTKLNDLWGYSLSNNSWSQITPTDEIVPEVRSGHTLTMCENNIIVFGGIHSVTKEMNDVYAFCIPQKRWINLCEQVGGSPIRNQTRNSMFNDQKGFTRDQATPPPVEATPLKENNAEMTSSIKKQPTRGKSSATPGKRGSSAMKNAARRRQSSNKESTTARQNQVHVPVYAGTVTLNDPISVQMQSTFLIKNHNDANFDSYLYMMRRRKQIALATQNMNSNTQ